MNIVIENDCYWSNVIGREKYLFSAILEVGPDSLNDFNSKVSILEFCNCLVFYFQ